MTFQCKGIISLWHSTTFNMSLLTNPLSRELNLQVHFQSVTNCYIRILPEKDRVTNTVFILDTQYAAGNHLDILKAPDIFIENTRSNGIPF